MDYEMSVSELMRILGDAEKKIPISARADTRLAQLENEVFMFAGENQHRLKTVEEWEDFRRLTRHGLRSARRFNHERGKGIFGTLYATASHYLYNNPKSKLYRQNLNP